MLTASTYFTSVHVSVGLFGPGTATAFYVNGVDPSGTVQLRFDTNYGSGSLNGISDSDLAILQQIYASNGFLPDDEGNEVAPQFQGDGRVTSLALLEQYGYWNPFDSGSWSRLQNKELVLADQRHTVRTMRTDGTPAHEVKHDIVPGTYTPSGATQVVSLGEMFVYQYAGASFAIGFDFPDSAGVTSDGVVNQLGLVALREFLRDSYHSGTAIPDGGALTAANFALNRQYRVTYSDSSTFTWAISNLGEILYASGNVSRWWAVCSPATGETFDLVKLQSHIREVLQSVPVQTDSMSPHFGSLTAPVRASEIEFAGGYAIELWDGELRVVNKNTGIKRAMRGRGVIDVERLEVVPDDAFTGVPANSYWLPPGPNIEHVHYRGTPSADVVLWCQTPDLMALRDNEHPLRIKNFDDSGPSHTITIRANWGSRPTVAVLQPGEYCQLFVTHEEDGTGELVVELYDRTIIGAGHEVDFDDFSAIGSSTRHRLIRPGTIAYRSEESWTTDANGLVYTHGDGIVEFDISGEVQLGAVASDGRLTLEGAIYNRNANRASTETDAAFLAAFGVDTFANSVQWLNTRSGPWQRFPFRYRYATRMLPGWVYAFVLRDTAASVDLDDIRLISWNYTVKANVSLTRTWSP